jgi:hypothetical protein
MTLRRATAVAAVAVAAVSPFSSAVAGEAISWRSTGLRGGISDWPADEEFKQFEAFATWTLPWSHRWTSGWSVRTFLEACAGTLQAQGESGFIGSVGPGGALTNPNGRVELSAGLNPTYLSRHEFRDKDLGGPVAFTTHFGLDLRLGRHGVIGLRWQHTSNAYIYDQNPGYNLIMLHAGYGF